MKEELIKFLAQIIAVAIVISFHEFAHAFVAVKCGDYTPKANNRLSLNPFDHFDLFGFLAMVLVGFGWAKPVPINPDNFKDRKKGILLVSSAGVITNVLLAFIIYPIYLLTYKFLPDLLLFDELITCTLEYIFLINLSFAIFNFLPFFPLDGFNVLYSIVKKRDKIYYFLRTKGYIVLLILIGIHYLSGYIPFVSYLDIFGYFMNFATNALAWPITNLWKFIIK